MDFPRRGRWGPEPGGLLSFSETIDYIHGMDADFEIIGRITNIETIAIGRSIRELPQLRARFGNGRWRKRKGIAKVRLLDGMIRSAEVHWYEAHGIGKVRMKIKRYLD